jgi:excisionase family DNA binding protein
MARIFTVDQAAEYLHVSPYTVRKWLRAGKIPGRKIGRMYRILEAELEAMLRGSHALDFSGEPADTPISEDELTWRKREEASRERARAKRLEWEGLTPEQKRERIDSLMGKYADLAFSSEDLIRERRADGAREERLRQYRDWRELSPEEKKARAESAMGACAHILVSSEDVIRERRAEVELEEERFRKLFKKT